jgi:transcriptional regulator with XRE-family HTH domain
MEFGEKLQQLRKQKGITQQALADALFVSRTAVSKWESGRGYPEIESLRAIARFFGVTVDALLSSDEILALAEENQKRAGKHFQDLVFGLSDLFMALLFFLPLFNMRADGGAAAAPLFSLGIRSYLKILYLVWISLSALLGALTLLLSGRSVPFFSKKKAELSLCFSVIASLLFVLGLHPYAAAFSISLLVIKVAVLLKRP